jgi:PelA/Pel-15E family pectate lyase
MRPVLPIVVALATSLSAVQTPAVVGWEALLAQPAAWYGTPEATRIADNLLLYQRHTGGWPKNTDMTTVLTSSDARGLLADKASTDSTIDNGATTTEIEVLARVRAATGQARFADGALAGIDYLLRAQYPNGGWPQYFPLRDDYSRHITFNDDAVARVLTLLRLVAGGRPPYEFVDMSRRARVQTAVDRGLEVILASQIRVNGQLTVWCAQHDAATLAPVAARAYELPSFSGSESVKIVRYLMSLPDPSSRVVAAIDAAVEWLRAHALHGIRVERRPDPSTPRGYDLVVVEDPAASPIWARFYDLDTGRPIFVGRDGIKRDRLSEIEYERRTGYSYLGPYATALLEVEYPAWAAARRRP